MGERAGHGGVFQFYLKGTVYQQGTWFFLSLNLDEKNFPAQWTKSA